MTDWIEPGIGALVTCETTAANQIHVRRIVTRAVSLHGHIYPQPKALCGATVAWDTMIPVGEETCPMCKDSASKVPR